MSKLGKLQLVVRTVRKEKGQTSAEYAVVLSVLTVGAAAVFTALSGGVSGAVSNAANLL
jgi:Flp pilus assembly pilin Flp